MLALLDPSRQDIPEYSEYMGAIQRAASAGRPLKHATRPRRASDSASRGSSDAAIMASKRSPSAARRSARPHASPSGAAAQR